MRPIFLTFLAVVSYISILAQDTANRPIDPKNKQVYIVPAIIIDGDTLAHFTLHEVEVVTKSGIDVKQLDYLTRCVMKAYPYARITAETLREMDQELAKIHTKKERKKYLDWAEDELKNAFEKDLKKLTYNQGRILIKLVNRETGRTSYELIRELKGGFSAFMWQGVARLFGANLKTEFDAKKEDHIIDIIVHKIEKGELPVARITRKSVVRNVTAAK